MAVATASRDVLQAARGDDAQHPATMSTVDVYCDWVKAGETMLSNADAWKDELGAGIYPALDKLQLGMKTVLFKWRYQQQHVATNRAEAGAESAQAGASSASGRPAARFDRIYPDPLNPDVPVMTLVHCTSYQNKNSILQDSWLKGSSGGRWNPNFLDQHAKFSLQVHAGCSALREQVVSCFQVTHSSTLRRGGFPCCRRFGPAHVKLEGDVAKHALQGEWFVCIPEEPNASIHDFWDVYIVRAAFAIEAALRAFYPQDKQGGRDEFGVFKVGSFTQLDSKLHQAWRYATEYSGGSGRVAHLHLHVLTAKGLPLPGIAQQSQAGSSATTQGDELAAAFGSMRLAG